MNVKLRARSYVDTGEVRHVLYKNFSIAIADVLMDWLRDGIEKDTSFLTPRHVPGKFGGHKR